MLILIVSSVLAGLAVLGVYRLEGRLGLGPLFAFAIAGQAFQNFPVSTVLMDVLRFPTSPGSAVLVGASLAGLGLEEALEGLAEQVQEEIVLEVSIECDGALSRLPEELAAVFYPTTRELVRNAIKHAQAEKIRIQVALLPEETRITVHDDGAGSRDSDVRDGFSKDGGSGLFSVREQVHRLGGHLVIDSGPGRGSRVTISAPFEPTKQTTQQ